MRVFKYGKIFETFYPNRLWSVKTNEKDIYLTFDDGPVPEATPYVLDQLDKYNAKATFFMVGDNVKKNSDLFQDVINRGHRVANHTMNHVNGSHCRKSDYLENIDSCQNELHKDNEPKLFRPPYGKMTKKQERELTDYKIIMWSVLGYDFDPNLSSEDCLRKITELTRAGSVVLLHDSVKTIDKLKYVLPRFLEDFTNRGYQFKTL